MYGLSAWNIYCVYRRKVLWALPEQRRRCRGSSASMRQDAIWWPGAHTSAPKAPSTYAAESRSEVSQGLGWVGKQTNGWSLCGPGTDGGSEDRWWWNSYCIPGCGQMASALPVSTILHQNARPEWKRNFMLSRVIRPIINSCRGNMNIRKERRKGNWYSVSVGNSGPSAPFGSLFPRVKFRMSTVYAPAMSTIWWSKFMRTERQKGKRKRESPWPWETRPAKLPWSLRHSSPSPHLPPRLPPLRPLLSCPYWKGNGRTLVEKNCSIFSI